jgi:hypothetical protein
MKMDRLCDQALAGARLARQQDRAVGPGDGLDHLEDFQHRLAAADDVRELMRQTKRSLQQHVLLTQLPVLDLLPDFHLEQVDVERLAQVVARAESHRFDRCFRGCERGDHDPQNVLVDLFRGTQHIDAAQIRHLDVGDQQIDRLTLQRIDCRTAVVRQHDLVAFPPQDNRQQFAHRSLIVDHENARRSADGRRRGRFTDVGCAHLVTTSRTGRLTETVVPVPCRELTWISP